HQASVNWTDITSPSYTRHRFVWGSEHQGRMKLSQCVNRRWRIDAMGHSRRIDGLLETSAVPPIAPGKRAWRQESYGPRLCEKSGTRVERSNSYQKLKP